MVYFDKLSMTTRKAIHHSTLSNSSLKQLLLNCHTYYSLKHGILSISGMLEEVKRGGHEIFALADINNTSACMYTLKDAEEQGLKPVIGIDFRNPVGQVGGKIHQQYIGLARNNAGFKALNEHLSYHIHNEQSFKPLAPDMENVFIIYPFENHPKPILLKEHEYIGIRPEQLRKLPLSPWRNSLHKLVVLQTATFRNKRDYNAHRLLRAIDNNALLSQLPVSEQGQTTDLYRSIDELRDAFAAFPQIIKNTMHVLESCEVTIDFTTNKNKNPYTDSIAEDCELLRNETYAGFAYRYGHQCAQTGSATGRKRTEHDQTIAVQFVLFGELGHGALRPTPQLLLCGSRQWCQQFGGLSAAHNRCGSRRTRPVL